MTKMQHNLNGKKTTISIRPVVLRKGSEITGKLPKPKGGKIYGMLMKEIDGIEFRNNYGRIHSTKVFKGEDFGEPSFYRLEITCSKGKVVIVTKARHGYDFWTKDWTDHRFNSWKSFEFISK